jgi:hypothetical protein
VFACFLSVVFVVLDVWFDGYLGWVE